MTDIPADLLFALKANGVTSRLRAARQQAFDPWPVVKLYNPLSAATWLATEIDEDGDICFGLADLGFGCPELGYFSLAELRSVPLPLGLRIERDQYFDPRVALSVWAETARRLGSILSAESEFLRKYRDELPLF
jgi:hypothetical protein